MEVRGDITDPAGSNDRSYGRSSSVIQTDTPGMEEP